ncbi:hypothetical protein [Paenibacillus herberti]|nr:hypothetical protein [Paenibacillus herberti]
MSLTLDEILYMVSLLGLKHFPGLEAATAEDNFGDLQKFMNKQQISLERKKCLEVDFSGEIRILPEMERFARAGASSSRYLLMAIDTENGAGSRYYYFFDQEKAYELERNTVDASCSMVEMHGLYEMLAQIASRISSQNSELDKEGESRPSRQISLAAVEASGDEAHVVKSLHLLSQNNTEVWQACREEGNPAEGLATLSFFQVMDLSVRWLWEAADEWRGLNVNSYHYSAPAR